ncbi:MAG: hypothetical protein FMNOHCHN_03269 [Ignavibacteriaceae bacterium]|nr:hypothetical protein [Ignavibacteriaceae bacterium]
MKSLFLFYALLLFAGSGFPQDSVFTPKYAISFGIGQNFTLTKFNGEIAVKKIMSNSDQIRILFQPFYDSYTNDLLPEQLNYSTQIVENNRIEAGLGTDYLWRVSYYRDIFVYAGPGISISYRNAFEKRRSHTGSGVYQTSETEQYRTGIELRGTISAEWKVSEMIGIHCEYRLGFSHSSDKIINRTLLTGNPDSSNEQRIKRLGLASVAVFGLSVYF